MAKENSSTELSVRDGGRTETSLSINNYNYDERIALLTPQEREHYDKLASAINPKDANSIQTYGTDLSKTIARTGDTLLQSVRSTSNNELAQLTNELLGELNLIDVGELSTDSKFKAFLRSVPILRKLVKTVEGVMIKYDTISENVDKISKKIDATRIVAMRDNSSLAQIFDSDKEYIRQMRELILAAKLKVKDLDAQIDEMVAHPEQYEAFDVKKMITFRNSLEKRIADMQTSEYTLTQSLFQVETIAAGNSELAQRADNIVNNVIPIWRNQLANSVIIHNQQNSIEAQQKITDATNKMLKANADNIHRNAVAVAKANEDPVIALETLEHTTQELVNTIKEVKQIHDQGAANRKNLESSLKKYSEQLESVIAENA